MVNHETIPVSRFAYVEWSWGAKEKQQLITACKELSEVGFHNIELVRDFVDIYNGNTTEFLAVMREYEMHPFSFYFMMQPDPMQDVADLYKKIDFMARAGAEGLVLQGIWDGTPATQEDLDRQLRAITAFGKAAASYNMKVTIHPHHHTKIMYATDIAYLMERTDPEQVGLCPDLAHLASARIDPVSFVKENIGRIYALHLKDIEHLSHYFSKDYNITEEPYASFCVLGKGDIDLPAIFQLLKDGGYAGYWCVEQDAPRTTNLDEAKQNFAYLNTQW